MRLHLPLVRQAAPETCEIFSKDSTKACPRPYDAQYSLAQNLGVLCVCVCMSEYRSTIPALPICTKVLSNREGNTCLNSHALHLHFFIMRSASLPLVAKCNTFLPTLSSNPPLLLHSFLQSITRTLIGIILMFLLCHTGKVCLKLPGLVIFPKVK